MLAGSVLSLTAALGPTMLVFGALDPGAGLTFYVPFAAAVLLLAFVLFRQLAFTMFVGIMLDVLVVRSLLLPAALTVVGRWSS